MPRLRSTLLIASALLCLGAAQATAATVNTTFGVTATVLKVCLVSANPLNFGNYDPTSGTPTDAATNVSVLCTVGTGFNVGLNAGTGAGATVANRLMTQGPDTLGYSLYQDAPRTTLWGNTVGTDTVAGTAGILPTSLDVYGRVPAGQNVPVGTYNDTIQVTVTY